MNEPLSAQVQNTFRQTLNVNSAPPMIDTGIPPQVVAVIQTPTPEIKFADATHAGASTSTIFTGTGQGQYMTALIVSAETSTSGNFQVAVGSRNIGNFKIALNTTLTVPILLDKPVLIKNGVAVTMTTSNAGFNIAGCIHYYDR